MRLIEVKIENFKRISAVEIQPPDGVLEIRGRNAQGKSSVLDAIEAALAGAAASPDRPIRNGERKAMVRCSLGEYVVTRRWTDGGSPNGNLTVTRKDGQEIRSPQATLSALFGLGSFDPFAFVGAEPKQQAKMLCDLVKIDVSDLDQQRSGVYNERTEVNASIKIGEADLTAKGPVYPDAPAAELVISELLAEIRAANELVRQNNEVRAEPDRLAAFVTANNAKIVQGQKQASEIRAQIAQLERDLKQNQEDAAGWAQENADLAALIEEAKATAAALVDPDVAALEQRLTDAEGLNRRVRHNLEVKAAQESLVANRDHADRLTARLAHIDADRMERFRLAPYPVAGLGFDGEQVLFSGLPISQASTAEQIKIGLAICSALAPQLKTILVRDGSSLDRDAMSALRAWALDREFQVLIERVDERGGDGAILIEDGQLSVG